MLLLGSVLMSILLGGYPKARRTRHGLNAHGMVQVMIRCENRKFSDMCIDSVLQVAPLVDPREIAAAFECPVQNLLPTTSGITHRHFIYGHSSGLFINGSRSKVRRHVIEGGLRHRGYVSSSPMRSSRQMMSMSKWNQPPFVDGAGVRFEAEVRMTTPSLLEWRPRLVDQV